MTQYISEAAAQPFVKGLELRSKKEKLKITGWTKDMLDLVGIPDVVPPCGERRYLPGVPFPVCHLPLPSEISVTKKRKTEIMKKVEQVEYEEDLKWCAAPKPSYRTRFRAPSLTFDFTKKPTNLTVAVCLLAGKSLTPTDFPVLKDYNEFA